MRLPTTEAEWLNAVDSLGAALGQAARAGDTARVDQIQAERNELQSHRPTSKTR